MDEINKIGPKLSEIPKKNNFEVPDDYFDRLPTLIQKKIEANEKKSFSFRSLLGFLKPQLALVAGMAIFALAMYFVIKVSVNEDNNAIPKNQVAVSAENETDELTDYYLNNIEENTIIDAYIDNSTLEEEISDEELMNYIADNVDTYTIIDNY